MPQYEAIWLQKSSETSAQHDLLYSRSSYTLSERRQTNRVLLESDFWRRSNPLSLEKPVVTSSHLTPNELPISETRHSLTPYEGKCFSAFCHTTKKKHASLVGNFPFSPGSAHLLNLPTFHPHLFPPQDACRMTIVETIAFPPMTPLVMLRWGHCSDLWRLMFLSLRCWSLLFFKAMQPYYSMYLERVWVPSLLTMYLFSTYIGHCAFKIEGPSSKNGIFNGQWIMITQFIDFPCTQLNQ